jgi:anti-sigma B factor antagonist
MDSSMDDGLIRDADADRVVDPADHALATTDLDVQAWIEAEPTPATLDVRRVDHPLGLVLTLGGELDIATAPVLQEHLDPVMPSGATVAIDLSRLRFIDSSGLRMLLQTEQQLRDSGGRLVLVRGSRTVHRLFELTCLDSHFEFCDSPSAALGERRIGSRPEPARTARPRPNPAATTSEERRGHE